MAITWELREYDREFFARELEAFVPPRVFDAHAHLYRIEHWSDGRMLSAGPAVADLATYRAQHEWLMPGREVNGLFFGVGFHQGYPESNDFVAMEVGSSPGDYCQMIVPPDLDAEELRSTAKSIGVRGLKVYHTMAPRKPTWNAEISEFLTEQHVRIADEEGWTITLHMVKDRSLADRGNQHWIRYYCTKYPDMQLILAHAARGFNAFHTIEGVESLRGLRNVWCDVSGVTEPLAVEAILEVLGPDRVLWGSDYPISHLRGRCVSIGDRFVWLYEDTLNWNIAMPQASAELFFVGHESLRALKYACRRMCLSDSQVEDVFYRNGKNLMDRHWVS